MMSLTLAWWLIKTGYLHTVVDRVLPVRFAAEIIAGALYTSFLTAPISVATLIVIAESNNPIIVALLGGLGAVVGDMLIVKLFRDNLSKDVKYVSHELKLQIITKFLNFFHLGFIIPLIGMIIIASPFPDELGLVMLGGTNLKYRELIVLTYVLNTAGILLIVLPANLL